MKLAYYIKKDSLRENSVLDGLFGNLRAVGCKLYPAGDADEIVPGTDALLSIGGDGTFLMAAGIAVRASVPVLGVNFGRLGFLSEASPEELPRLIAAGELFIEERELLKVGLEGAGAVDFWPLALNEVSVSRVSASMLGIDVTVDGSPLPTYWADGLLVATSSGSTAYSLSAGGPICMPDSKVFIVAPICPHNLNVRPLIVPLTSTIGITLRSRDENVVFTMDNRDYTVPARSGISVCAAPVRLKRMCAGRSNFINALKTRLLWGEDVRNGNDSL